MWSHHLPVCAPQTEPSGSVWRTRAFGGGTSTGRERCYTFCTGVIAECDGVPTSETIGAEQTACLRWAGSRGGWW